MQSTLPKSSLATLYRAIVTRLSTHILRRLILQRGERQVTPHDGRHIRSECELWVQTCHTALAGSAGVRVDAPWGRLLQAGRILGAEEEFRELVQSTRRERDEQKWRELMLGLTGEAELSRNEALEVMRLRSDFDM